MLERLRDMNVDFGLREYTDVRPDPITIESAGSKDKR
jgi:hypothetical protein